MKALFLQIVFAAVTLGFTVSVSYGDLTTPEKEAFINSNASLDTLRINDNTGDTNLGVANPLYRIFNEYFHDELSTLGIADYTSGNALADDRMIRQTISSWQVNPGSTVAASFSSSALQHGLQIYSTTGNLLFDTGKYSATIDGASIINGTEIVLEGGKYVFSVFSDNSYGWVSGFEGTPKEFSGDHDWYLGSAEYQNESWAQYYEEDGIQHLITLDITDLMRQRTGFGNIESAFLFAFEDLNATNTDFDYQDFAFILTNVTANVVPATTPEPATALILGIAGCVALPFLRRKSKKNQ
jgi:hypothetical protein